MKVRRSVSWSGHWQWEYSEWAEVKRRLTRRSGKAPRIPGLKQIRKAFGGYDSAGDAAGRTSTAEHMHHCAPPTQANGAVVVCAAVDCRGLDNPFGVVNQFLDLFGLRLAFSVMSAKISNVAQTLDFAPARIVENLGLLECIAA